MRLSCVLLAFRSEGDVLFQRWRHKRAFPGTSRWLGIVGAAAQHLHVGGDYLGRVLIPSLLVLPLASAQPPFDEERSALLEVLADDLGQAAEKDDPVPLRLLDPVS